jgi:hypothetical protein
MADIFTGTRGQPRVTDRTKIARKRNKCNRICQKLVVNHYNSLHLNQNLPRSAGGRGEFLPTAQKRELPDARIN